MTKARIKIKLLRSDVYVPNYAHGSDEDAGMDLRAAEDVTLQPQTVVAVSTGIQIEIPSGLQGEVRSRSGLALRGVVCNNAPGTIDPGYRGEVKAILRNQNQTHIDIKKGDRIAQLVVVPYVAVEWDRTEDLTASARGEGGLGSTGVS